MNFDELRIRSVITAASFTLVLILKDAECFIGLMGTRDEESGSHRLSGRFGSTRSAAAKIILLN